MQTAWLLDDVKNGYGKAVLPKHLIEQEKDLEILASKTVLKIPVYLRFYRQPFYRSAHEEILRALTSQANVLF